jgi:transcriptional regulator with XRE-family HTH domain
MEEVKKRFLKKFGQKIQEVRKKQDVSQEKLAQKADIERSYMGRIERGESNPPVFTVHKILQALNISASELGL